MKSFIPERLSPGAGTPASRIRVLSILATLLFVVYASYLFYLQVINGSEYRDRAHMIATQASIIPAQRGEIFDRTDTTPLVVNADSFAVELTPAELPAKQREATFSKLAATLGISVDDIKRKVPPVYYHLYQPIEILGSVPYTTITTIAERIDEFPGVSWRSKPIRDYLEPGSISHVIGYVGDITRDELKVLYNEGYKSGDVIGKDGVEKQYDKVLRGQDGWEYRTVDVRGRRIGTNRGKIVPPVMGSNLVLTIDNNMQQIAEKALGPRMGSVVILRPATGEVLAMVSYPWYNPNDFTGIHAGEAFSKLLADPNTPLLNRTIQSSYPPASTFKIVLTTAIIEEKAFPLHKKVLCTGQITYGGRVWNCWVHKPGHGWLDLKGGLAQSCDIYFWTVGRDYLGVERIVSYSKEFGFGKATDIDLPGEIDGFIPTPQWKERHFHEKWVGGDTMNMSIGQGYVLVTPLQLADMMAMVVNSGTIYRPHVLKEIRDPSTGAIIKEVQPQVLIHSDISAATFAKVRDYLRNVIVNGTARFPLNTKAVEIAGKTGTAEVGRKNHWHSWLVSFGPYNAPPKDQIVVVVMVEASNTWEWWAPYATDIIYQAIFAKQTYDQAVDTLGLRYLVREHHWGRVE